MNFTEADEEKFKSGIDMVFSQWPLLVGVIETSWGEYDRKKLKFLPKLMDCKPYNFSKLPYTEVRAVFINELTNYMLEVDTTPEDVAEFMQVFMDEVFDSVPDSTDKSHRVAASAISQLLDTLLNNDDTVLDAIKKRFEASKGITFVAANKEEEEEVDDCGCETSDCEHSTSKMQEEIMEEDYNDVHEEIEAEEMEKKAKKKAKKQGNLQLDEEDMEKLKVQYQPDTEDMDNNGWNNA